VLDHAVQLRLQQRVVHLGNRLLIRSTERSSGKRNRLAMT
jgi:hypothetical protein